MAGRALAQAGQPGARRAQLPAEGLEGRRALRLRDLVRLRPRDQRAARRRQVDRPHGLGPVRQPRRRAAHPAAVEEIRRAGDLLRAGRRRPALSRRAAPGDRRGARDRHPQLDPRAQFGALLRGGKRHHASRRRHAGEDHRRAPGRLAHRLVGFLAAHAAHHQGDGAALRLLADGGRGLLRAHARRRADRRGRAAGRMGARRRGLFHDAPLPEPAPADAAEAVFDIFRREFDAAYEEGGICQITRIRT